MLESKIEEIKRAGKDLRGTIADELQNGHDSFSFDASQLLKFHGIYVQDNRDTRSERKRSGRDVEHICMVRLAIPGGRLLAHQYLALEELAEIVGNGTLRVTTRQGIQFHFVAKDDLAVLLNRINGLLLTTYAGCGDVVRNVTACPSTSPQIEALGLGDLADEISRRYKPRSSAYHEIWVDGEKVSPEVYGGGPDADDPIYGAAYLPRKFKIGITSTIDNCVDVLSCDLAIVIDADDPSSAEIHVGGGLGRAHSDETTEALLGRFLARVGRSEVFDVIDAVIAIQRDHGERSDRSHARFKYLVKSWGIDRIRKEVEAKIGHRIFADTMTPMGFQCCEDHLGWTDQAGGKVSLGIKIPSGRILDGPTNRFRSAIKEAVSRYGLSVRFSAKEDVLLCDIEPRFKSGLVSLLRSHGIPLHSEIPGVFRQAFACPALPTCGLALTESERFLPAFLAELHAELAGANMADLDVEIRMTGCPNGCARPYLAEIGIVGRSKRSYDIYLGADRRGTRLGELYAKDIGRGELVEALRPVLTLYAKQAAAQEQFGDFCYRYGVDKLKEFAPAPRRTRIEVA